MWNASITINVSDKDRAFIEDIVGQLTRVVQNIPVPEDPEPENGTYRIRRRDFRGVSMDVSFANEPVPTRPRYFNPEER